MNWNAIPSSFFCQYENKKAKLMNKSHVTMTGIYFYIGDLLPRLW